MQITYYGHSCFGVEVGGKSLLFDPFISHNPLAKDIDIATIKPDYILISHGHSDHIADAEAIARQSGALIVSNYEVVSWLAAKGITNGHGMNFGGAVTFDFGKVKFVQAVHSSGLPDGSYGGNPGGFIIETEEGNFYFAGDTALTMDMQLYGRKELAFAFLPIGDNFTMGVDDAVTAANFIKCKHIIAMHYDTFPPITIDKDEALRKFRNAEVELIFFGIGETKTI